MDWPDKGGHKGRLYHAVRGYVNVTRREAEASGYGRRSPPARALQPASAGLVNVAEGFSPTASDGERR